MRPQVDPQLPQNPPKGYAEALNYALKNVLRRLTTRVNALADGQISAIDNAALVAPTTGTYAQGDFIRNKAPTVLGAPGSKYVVFGFLCVAGGSPGTWSEVRVLTGG